MQGRNIKNKYQKDEGLLKRGKKGMAAALAVAVAVCLLGCQKEEAGFCLEEAVLETEAAQQNNLPQNNLPQNNLPQNTLPQNTLPQETDCVQEETEAETLFVYVCGAVQTPGVYELQKGSRVFEAVLLAGGFSEDACKEYVNLAQEISDAMKIYIPTVEQAENGDFKGDEGAGREDSESADSKININTAGKEKLLTLPGIGESRAESIIAYREERGGFAKIEDIMNVSGIKEGAFQKIKDKICVE